MKNLYYFALIGLFYSCTTSRKIDLADGCAIQFEDKAQERHAFKLALLEIAPESGVAE